ncbi:MAG: SDR family oxidoreductase [Chitinophagaceae bacterium]
MQKVLLFGGTGQLGRKVADELINQQYDVTAVVRNEQRKFILQGKIKNLLIANVTKPEELHGICKGFDVIVSTLGKSVSPNDKSKSTFQEIDYEANATILQDAINEKIKKFVYVSAFHAEKYPHLTYFSVHHDFSEKVKASGIDYTIVKPTAIFTAFIDLIEMAEKGRLMTIGSGKKLTNPIDATDLARIIVDGIKMKNAIIEAGGKTNYSRQQINELIQQSVNPKKKVRKVPLFMIRSFLPALKILNRNLFDKFAFFTAVMQSDTIAPAIGTTTLEQWLDTVPELKK